MRMKDYIKQGDCLGLMQEIPSRSIDMILCDLPYGATACEWDKIIPFESLWTEYKRIIKKHGAIVLFGKEPFSSRLVTSNIKGFKHKWVWNKKLSGSFNLAKFMPLQITEDVLVFTGQGEKVNYYPIMRKGKMRNRGGAKKTNAVMNKGFQLGYACQSDEYYPTNLLQDYPSKRTGRFHPTEKPIALLEYLIKTYSKEGELVLDNCIGSGSTAIACINTHRHFIGYDIKEEFCEIAERRIKEARSNENRYFQDG